MRGLNQFNSNKITLATVAVFAITVAALTFFIPPTVGSDASWGFLVLHNMEHGANFNIYLHPDSNNINNNQYVFLTWWSPGQYLFPYFFKWLFHLNDGQAMSFTTGICNIIGLAGFYRFFSKAGFSKNVSALSVAFIFCQRLFVIPYTEYLGGEVPLFAFMGWFLYAILSINQLNLITLFFIFLSGWIGFICKSSFLWMYLAGMVFIWWRLSHPLVGFGVLLKNSVGMFITIGITLLTIYLAFVSKGQNPSSSQGWLSLISAFKLSWFIFLFPAGAPVITNLSVDELLNGIGSYGAVTEGLICFTATLLTISLLRYIKTQIKLPDYQLIVFIFYTACLSFFVISYLRSTSISFEPRHFRLLGLITIPSIVHFAANAKVVVKAMFILVAVILFVLNIGYIFTEINLNKSFSKGKSGITQPLMDQSTINYLAQLDKQNHNNIIVMPVYRYSYTMGLEITNSRLINFVENTIYHGHSGRLFLLIPTAYPPQRVTKMIDGFPDYKNFTSQKISPKFVIYKAE